MKTTEKFTGKADTYAKFRPGYPESCLDYLTEALAAVPCKMGADIGAGTGILTRQLLERGFCITAVEPNGDMRKLADQSLSSYPGYRSCDGSAESTGLENQSVDFITVAQAFHWFDGPKFAEECRRILKPDGQVALIWNNRDADSPLVKENAEVCRQFCPQFKGFSGGHRETPEMFRRFFRDGCYEARVFPHHLQYYKDEFVGRNLSSSYAPKPGEQNYEGFVAAVQELFDRHAVDGVLYLPNLTNTYVGRV